MIAVQIIGNELQFDIVHYEKFDQYFEIICI